MELIKNRYCRCCLRPLSPDNPPDLGDLCQECYDSVKEGRIQIFGSRFIFRPWGHREDIEA